MDPTSADRIIGKQIFRYPTVSSTNDIARQLAACQADEGTVVVAAEQTLGRGSRGRAWISPAGVNLLLSVILRPPVERGRISELAFVAAVSVARFLNGDTGLAARVKWPNDVRVGGRKIAGILIEAPVCLKKEIPTAVVGIGVNINWTDLPPEIAETATSVLIETGRTLDLESALTGLLDSLDAVYRTYRVDGFEAVLADWRLLDCTTGEEVTVLLDGETVRGVAESVASDGSLVVRQADGSLRKLTAAGQTE
ncbi:MAG: biotin--[acetyl-CoA-carboxylase] ligase [Armatimonadota bacterium]|nr:biotin--[acetyl-CoA-carboxylase] ligase [Armatimonadota bacterium]